MQSLRIGNVRSGSLDGSVPLPAVKDATFHIEVQGQDSGEVHIPFAALTAAQNANISDLYLPDPGSLPSRYVILEDDTNGFLWAFPIGKIESSRTEGEKAEHVLGLTSLYKGILANIPAIPSSKRAAINDSTATWKKTNSSYAGLYGSFGADSCNETGDGLKFPQSILWTTGDGSATDVTNTVTVSEMPSITDLFDNLAGSYPNIETVFRGEYTDSSKTAIQWRQVSGTAASPHYQKDTNLGSFNLDDPASTVKSIEVSNDGMNQSPSWFAGQSQSYDTAKGKENWIDLTSKWATAPSGNTRYMHKFSKESFDSYLSAAELEAQENARVADSSTYRKTYTIKVWGWNWLNALGKTLTVQSSQKWGGLNEQLRITAIDWTINDPSSIELTVMPKNLARFPRVPRHTADRTQDALDKNKKGSAFKKTPLSSLGGVGGLGTGTGGLGGSGGSGTTITTPTIPTTGWGEQGSQSALDAVGTISLSAFGFISGPGSTKYGNRIYSPAAWRQAWPTSQLGTSFVNIPIHFAQVNGTGTMIASNVTAGTLPASYLNTLRSNIPDATYGGSARRSETIFLHTWAVNDRYYVHMTLIVQFGTTQSPWTTSVYPIDGTTTGERFSVLTVYCGINSDGTLNNVWSTTPSPYSPTTGNPIMPNPYSIFRYGSKNQKIGMMGFTELVDWTGSSSLAPNFPYLNWSLVSNDFTTGADGSGWVGGGGAPDYAPESTGNYPMALFSTFSANDGYVYIVNHFDDSIRQPTPANGMVVKRTDGTKDTLGAWTTVAEFPAPSRGGQETRFYGTQIAVVSNYVIVQYSSVGGSSSAGFAIKDLLAPGTTGWLEAPASVPGSFHMNSASWKHGGWMWFPYQPRLSGPQSPQPAKTGGYAVSQWGFMYSWRSPVNATTSPYDWDPGSFSTLTSRWFVEGRTIYVLANYTASTTISSGNGNISYARFIGR